MVSIQAASGSRLGAAINSNSGKQQLLATGFPADFSAGIINAASSLRELQILQPDLASKFKIGLKELIQKTGIQALSNLKLLSNKVLDYFADAGLISAENLNRIKKYAAGMVSRFSALKKVPESTSGQKRLQLRDSVKTVSPESGFLWKPIADSPPHGLVILLPQAWSAAAQGISILDPSGSRMLASGKDGGIGNGGRRHFRFGQEGQSFPGGSLINISFKDGSSKSILIKDTSKRSEVR